jgi:hypothetical protein
MPEVATDQPLGLLEVAMVVDPWRMSQVRPEAGLLVPVLTKGTVPPCGSCGSEEDATTSNLTDWP